MRRCILFGFSPTSWIVGICIVPVDIRPLAPSHFGQLRLRARRKPVRLSARMKVLPFTENNDCIREGNGHAGNRLT